MNKRAKESVFRKRIDACKRVGDDQTAGWVKAIRRVPELADVDPEFRCVMKKPKRKTKLSSIDYTYGKGTIVLLPSRSVFVLDSGEVLVARGRGFVSLATLVERAKKKKHTVLTNYSK